MSLRKKIRKKKKKPVKRSKWKSIVFKSTTIVMAILTGLSMIPYQLGKISVIIPAEWKADLLAVAGVSTVILGSINSFKNILNNE